MVKWKNKQWEENNSRVTKKIKKGTNYKELHKLVVKKKGIYLLHMKKPFYTVSPQTAIRKMVCYDIPPPHTQPKSHVGLLKLIIN